MTPLVVRVSPAGRRPVLVKAGGGVPVAVKLSVAGCPAVRVAWPLLVMAGAWRVTRLREPKELRASVLVAGSAAMVVTVGPGRMPVVARLAASRR